MKTALLAAREAQTAYWEALLALEDSIGVEVDGAQDLQDATVTNLIEGKDDSQPISPQPMNRNIWVCPGESTVIMR